MVLGLAMMKKKFWYSVSIYKGTNLSVLESETISILIELHGR